MQYLIGCDGDKAGIWHPKGGDEPCGSPGAGREEAMWDCGNGLEQQRVSSAKQGSGAGDCPDCTTVDGGVPVNTISMATKRSVLKSLGLSAAGVNYIGDSINNDVVNDVYFYLELHKDPNDNYADDANAVAKEWIEFYVENIDVNGFVIDEATIAANITVELLQSNKLTSFNDDEYNIIIAKHLPPDFLGILTYYNLHVQREIYSIISTEYENGHQFSKWELFKIVLRAQKEAIHFGLDAAGMAPGVGIVFDITNAAIYTVEMDWTNATLSLGSAVPIAGQWVTTAKWAKKVVALTNGKKVYLKVYNLIDGTIKFSNRNQLRKVLGITDSALHAHHIIPYGLVDNLNHPEAWELIQLAAKSNNVFHINDIYNGIEMINNLHLTGHSTYTARIIERMTDIYNGMSNPNAYDEAYNGLIDLCNEIKILIQQNPNVSSGQLATMF